MQDLLQLRRAKGHKQSAPAETTLAGMQLSGDDLQVVPDLLLVRCCLCGSMICH